MLYDLRGSRKYLNREERYQLLRVLERISDPLRRSFCLTLYHTGCRISEALNLTAERIDTTEGVIVFETLKRRKRGHFRAVPIPHALALLLADQIKAAPPDALVWEFSRVTGWRLVTQCMAQAGVSGAMAAPKGMRHALAVACLTSDVPITTVQKWLGHARLETTAIYLGVSGAEERRFAERVWEGIDSERDLQRCLTPTVSPLKPNPYSGSRYRRPEKELSKGPSENVRDNSATPRWWLFRFLRP